MLNSKARFILGSGSPRRYELFARFWDDGDFEIIVPDFDETTYINKWQEDFPDGSIGDLAASMSGEKAKRISEHINGKFVIVSADTIVVSDNKILGKPENLISARQMLMMLSGRKHDVITGLSVLVSDGLTDKIWTEYEKTEVKFCELTETITDWYVASGEPLDKAGAYGIQGLGSLLVESINGCYYNVMGLPVNRLMTMLQKAAVTSSEFDFICGFLPWN